MAFAPTAQQQAFLAALTDTTENLALEARAGCGKTSTIMLGVDALRAANERTRILVCAFNAAIVKAHPELAEVAKKAQEAMANRAKGGKGGEGKGKPEGKPEAKPEAK